MARVTALPCLKCPRDAGFGTAQSEMLKRRRVPAGGILTFCHRSTCGGSGSAGAGGGSCSAVRRQRPCGKCAPALQEYGRRSSAGAGVGSRMAKTPAGRGLASRHPGNAQKTWAFGLSLRPDTAIVQHAAASHYTHSTPSVHSLQRLPRLTLRLSPHRSSPHKTRLLQAGRPGTRVE